MVKIIVKGYQKDDQKPVEMVVHFEMEGYVWFDFKMKDGTKVQAGPFKETV